MAVLLIDLFASDIRLHQGGQARAEQRKFYPEGDDWQLRVFHVRTDADVHADHWEIHSDADEPVACLSGAIRLYFRPQQPGGEEEEVKLAAGAAVIVPGGQWHRIELDAPSSIMAVTVARESRPEKR